MNSPPTALYPRHASAALKPFVKTTAVTISTARNSAAARRLFFLRLILCLP